MKNLSELKRFIIPAVALIVGLLIGLSVGLLQLKSQEKVFQIKMKESNKKTALIQKRMDDEKTEANAAAASIEQNYRGEIEKLQNENKALGGQLAKSKEQFRVLETNVEAKAKEVEALIVKNKKELQEALEKNHQTTQLNKELALALKKIKTDKDTLQAQLKKSTKELSSCMVNNANLCVIGSELVQAYKNKGITTAILEKEPITQIKKVELEQLTEKYKDEIEQLKIKK